MDEKEALLREVVRRTLEEEWGDYGYGGSYGGVTPWSSGYGGSTKGSRSSMGMGTYGNSLYSIFIDPFVNAAKVVGAEVGKTGVNLAALLRTTLEAALQALLPKFKADFDKVQASRRKYLDKIKERYKASYEAIDDAWDNEDIQLFSFMRSPTAWLGYKAITAKPQAVLSVFDTLVEGNQALALYLRDIRNRLYGASTPGAGVPHASGQRAPQPATEGLLRENGKVAKTVDFQGLEVKIDRPKGFVQKGKNPEGEEWERAYLCDYGFIKGTEGGDGEDLDVFVGVDDDAPNVYLVTQKKLDGSFDEYKAFVGFETEDDALEAYEDHIPMEFFEDVCVVPIGALKGMLGLDPDVTLGEATAKPNVVKKGPTAVAKKPKTPAEQVAVALTDPRFIKIVDALPLVQQMRKDAAAIDNQTTTQLANAMAPVFNAASAEDLARASGGAWQPPPEFSKLAPDEKRELEDPLVAQTQAAMKSYYAAQIKALIKQLDDIGVSDQSPYKTSLRSMLSKVA